MYHQPAADVPRQLVADCEHLVAEEVRELSPLYQREEGPNLAVCNCESAHVLTVADG